MPNRVAFVNGVYSFVVVVALVAVGFGLLDGNGCDDGLTEEKGDTDECFM